MNCWLWNGFHFTFVVVHCILTNQKKLILYTDLLKRTLSLSDRSLSQLPLGERWGTTWSSRQLNSGLIYRTNKHVWKKSTSKTPLMLICEVITPGSYCWRIQYQLKQFKKKLIKYWRLGCYLWMPYYTKYPQTMSVKCYAFLLWSTFGCTL